jgi:hypothetical protein
MSLATNHAGKPHPCLVLAESPRTCHKDIMSDKDTDSGNKKRKAELKPNFDVIHVAKISKAEDKNVHVDSSGKYSVKVSDYFNKIYFFNSSEEYRVMFKENVELQSEETRKWLDSIVEDFYSSALKAYDTNIEGLENFFFKIIHGCDSQAVLNDFNEWKNHKGLNLKDDKTYEENRLPAELNRERDFVASIVKALTNTSDDEGRQAAMIRGREFVASIMDNIWEIQGRRGLRFLPKIPSLEFVGTYDLVIRKVTQPFWEECIKVVSTPDMSVRVCAVGTPGIGKTSSTPFLIRMLLQEKNIVVYRRLSASYFWEFEWKNQHEYFVTAYPKNHDISNVKSLSKSSTFYIVDPGSTRSNCAPDTEFEARTIIVASPNEGNWGSHDFEKQRGPVIGRFKYFPMWDLEDLLEAQDRLSSTPPSEEEIVKRFRQVGGVLRHILANEEDFQKILLKQNAAIDALTVTQAQKIVEGKLDVLGLFGVNQPRSAVIGYGAAKVEEEIPFSSPHVTIVSRSVTEKIAARFMGDLWNLMLTEEGHDAWWIFEIYCQQLMLTQPARLFFGRPGCGKKDPAYRTETNFTLGGCTAMRMGSNIAQAVLESDPLTLIHSANARHPLIDFIYKDRKGIVHAFQVTLQKTHKAKTDKIRELRETLGNLPLVLYYLIPAENFHVFVTNPVIPKTDELTSVKHIIIPNPKKESHLLPVSSNNSESIL